MQKQYKKYWMSFIFWVISNVLVLAHPIKMTTGKLVVDSNTQSCELTLNFFADDFESTLQKEYPQMPFDYQEPSKEMQETISNYIKNHFSLQLTDSLVVLKMKKIELIEENVCQVTLTGDIGEISVFEMATIKNTLLFEAFDKQSNILHLQFNGKKVAILQFYPETPVRKESLM